MLRLAATAELASHHPLAAAVMAEAATGRSSSLPASTAVRSLARLRSPGAASAGERRSRPVLVGNRRLAAEERAGHRRVGRADRSSALDERGETPLIVAVDGRSPG